MNEKLKKGNKVKIQSSDPKLNKMIAIVRYIGPLEDRKNEGDFVGV